MPNHVTHTITVTGPVPLVQVFRDLAMKKCEEDGERFDFNAFIKMPDILDGTRSPSEELLFIAGEDPDIVRSKRNRLYFGPYVARTLQYPWVKEEGITTAEELREFLIKRGGPKVLEEAMRAAQALKETGYADWYEWSVDNWGTKWNSYSFHEEVEECGPGKWVFHFDTAWSVPEPIFAKIHELFPELRIRAYAIDEGGGFAAEGAFGPGEVNGFVFRECTQEELGYDLDEEEEEEEETAE